RVKLLAYSGQQRSRFLPDLPTVAESGVPGYAFDSWLRLLAPAGTPAAEFQRLLKDDWEASGRIVKAADVRIE
ncbi:tripartite tricarboxylate transporter substrate-binding protein, partial [Delftia acidovorans]|uniref:tripartite tricarboxylate transporter substrate-binding protein n=1 Tax=Delftia acidovorans TaxID=80866 RepID=UPI0035A182C9